MNWFIKRILLVLFLGLYSKIASADVIFFPRQYSVFCYSAELTFSLEKSVKPKATNTFWGGIGCVGSFQYFNEPVFGLEIAYERRHYFKPDSYKNLFISSYMGTALMTDFESTKYIGFVPGFKINYKAEITKDIIAEPYVSLSVPIVFDLPSFDGYVPFPVLTIGARFGFGRVSPIQIN